MTSGSEILVMAVAPFNSTAGATSKRSRAPANPRERRDHRWLFFTLTAARASDAPTSNSRPSC